jgi:hypothetical protein
MGSCRRKNWIAVSLMLTLCALCALMPVAACANPLLSGYGGPGQGDQAILGATLLGGSSSGGGSSSSEAQAGTAAALTATEPAVRGGRRETGGAARPKKRSRPSASTQKPTGAADSGPASGKLALQADEGTSGDPLGLSGTDVLYILLTLGALALTGGLTLQLVRRAQ